MDPQLWKLVDDLFNKTIMKPPEEWSAFLKDQCGDNLTLLEEVQLLLDSYQGLEDDFLEPGHRNRLIDGLEPFESQPEGPGDDGEIESSEKAFRAMFSLWSTLGKSDEKSLGSIPDHVPETRRFGPFQLQEKLGEGGMGMVYKAVQNEPLQRTVAIKILRQALSSSLRHRFQVEAQSLSLLSEHPYIATLYEADTTPVGIPYYVMELINGQSCTSFCDDERLSIRARLELFLKMCEGKFELLLNIM